MATLSNTLLETIQLQDEESFKTSKFLSDSLAVSDQLSLNIRKELLESVILADIVLPATFFKTLFEDLSFSDKVSEYTSFPHQTFKVELYREGKTLNIDKADVIHFEFTKSLTEEIGDGYILFDNSEVLDYRAGDEIRIYWGSEDSGIYTLVYSGEIDFAEKEWDEEEAEQRLKLTFFDWGKLLLETKIDKSYATVTNVNSIIEQILNSITSANDPPYPNERKINISNIESYTKTRTVDFVGESLFDCLKKLALITESEFYVDQNKRLQFFSKNFQTTGKTLTIEDFVGYRYRTREDLIANTVKVFGNASKFSDNYDPDLFTENLDSYWSDDGSDGTLSLGPSTFQTAYSLAGTQVIAYTRTYPVITNGTLAMKCLFGKTYDLSLKQSYTELVFGGLAYPSGEQQGNSFSVYLIDNDGNRIETKAHKYNFSWWQPPSMIGTNVEFQEFRIPIGPIAETEGKWALTVGSSFDWSKVKGVAFKANFRNTSSAESISLWIDWLHFDKGKWYATYSDLTSMQDPPTGHGLRFKEILDDTIFSDVAAQRMALSYIIKYKDPIDFLYNTELLRELSERIQPGDIYTINVPELKAVYKDFKVRNITFSWDEEDMFEVRITLEEAL